jgi:eukaryotic-like serine/threonine-protein kinase
MTLDPQRWRLVKEIFSLACAAEGERRAALLERRCGTDAALRSEVESLLLHHGRRPGFLETPAAALAARWLADAPARLGAYRIVRLLGSGGMADVYLAERADSQFEKRVAAKIIKPGHGENLNSRFQTERQLLAGLDHPNIVRLLDGGVTEDGRPYLLMDYVDGLPITTYVAEQKPSLQERLALFLKVCDAVGYAHSRSIVHRDIKPGNILVTREGLPKLLDFGIAKLTEPQQPNNQANVTQTRSRYFTPEYASPEQVRGESVTAASDIYSLGLVLYQILSDHHPFNLEGLAPYEVERIVCEESPDLSMLSPGLAGIVKKATRKLPEQRYSEVDLFTEDLRRYLDSPKAVDARAGFLVRTLTDKLESWKEIAGHFRRGAPRNSRWILGLAAAAALVCVTLVVYSYSRTLTPQPEIVPLTSDPGAEYDPGLSPDGRQVVYAARNDQGYSILVKPVGGEQPRRLMGSSRGFYAPKWSPDGKWIAAVRTTERIAREAILIPAEGGSERVLTNMEGVWLAWTPDSKSVGLIDRTSPEEPLAVHLVSIRDGSRRRITNPPAGYWGDISCAFSPDGKSLAVLRYSIKGNGDVYVMNADGTDPRRLTHDETWITGVDWTPDSREIIYGGLRSPGSGLWRIQPGRSLGGSPVLIPGTAGRSLSPSVSRTPDGAAFRVAYQVDPFSAHVWKWELGKGVPVRLTASTRTDESPAISPDGRRIVFMSTRTGAHELWMCDSGGLNPVQLTFTKSIIAEEAHWSPDGRLLAFVSRNGGGQPIFVLDTHGGSPRRITAGSFDEGYPSWSADGRWIYSRSNQSGTPQVWKTPVDGRGEPVQVTKRGAVEGNEAPDGKVLYFVRGPDELGLWSVPVEGGEERKIPALATVRMGYWGVAAQGIVFIDVGRKEGAGIHQVKMFRFDTGKVSSLGEISSRNILIQGFSVTRDGRTILWNQVESQEPDLMLIDNFR